MSNKKRRVGWAHLPTEQIHPLSRNLDCQSPEEILQLMETEDHRAVAAVHEESKPIARTAKRMARTLEQGGRIFFLGAGTSGRLGVLEAAECPPTYGTAPRQIQAVVAGGRRAVFRSREGSEDLEAEAEASLRAKRLSSKDLVLGISASGVTSFVRGGLIYAHAQGAVTILLTCGPRVRGLADLVIAPSVGPEIIAGSTRLKAGTATKLVLNTLTVLTMIRLGKVYGPFMVDLELGSEKLQDRANRIVAAVAGVSRARAAKLLEEAGGEVKTAIVTAKQDVPPREARRRLATTSGNLRAALDMGCA